MRLYKGASINTTDSNQRCAVNFLLKPRLLEARWIECVAAAILLILLLFLALLE